MLRCGVEGKPSHHMAIHVRESTRELTAGAVSLVAVARLIRIEYCLLGALGVLGGALLVVPSLPDVATALSAVAVFLVAAGCYALDDYFDRHTDAANLRDDRPLVHGSPSPRVAAIIGIGSFTLAAMVAVAAAPSTALLVAAGAAAAMAYNRWLHGVPVVKNALLAGAFPAPIVIGGLAAGAGTPLLWYAATVAYVLGLGFEVMIDIGDVEGDLATGVVTLSTTRGTVAAARVSAVLLVSGAAIAALPFLLSIDERLQWDVPYAVMVCAAGIALAVLAHTLWSRPAPSRIPGLKLRAFALLHVFVLGYIVGVLF
jgi:4-hydroxybenzoate polyprenyltransferase